MMTDDLRNPAAPMFVCVGSIFIDDIVYPDGRTMMGVLGGAGTHAAAGVALWSERPGLVANAGTGMPDAAQAHMERDFDMRGVVQVESPQGRMWQIFEWNNRRSEIFRVDDVDIFALLPNPDKLHADYAGAKYVTVLRGAQNFMRWRRAFAHAFVLWEPDSVYMKAGGNHAEYLAALPSADIVSPNLLESQIMLGISEPDAIIRLMLDHGAKQVTLRMGERGSFAASQDQPDAILIPAVPVPDIIDQTGAGNAYGGGFIVGWSRTGDLRQAACYGAVSGSFALEVMGLADPTRANHAIIRDARLDWALHHTT